MKCSLIGLCLCLLLSSPSVSGRSYYISNQGSDANNGNTETTSWKSMDKINQSRLQEGDSILFRRGESFYGTLIIKGNNITVASYGAGKNKPTLSGSSALNQRWMYNNGTWAYSFAENKPAEIRGVVYNKERLPLSRMPNKDQDHGYFFIDKLYSNESFSGLQKGSWSGSEVIVRTERYRWVHSIVKHQNGQVINITPGPADQKLKAGFAFFFVNNINAIDKEGEWAYDKTKGTLYVKESKDFAVNDLFFIKQNYVIEVNASAAVHIHDLKIEHAGRAGIKIQNSTSVTVQNVDMEDIAGNGLTVATSTGVNIKDNLIDHVAWSGIAVDTKSSKAIVTGNTITNIGEEEFAVRKTFAGIDCNAPLSRIENNRIKNTGYAGIISAGRQNVIKRNIIDSVCLLLNDNGGIYLNNNINDVAGSVVEENFVAHAIGELAGAPSSRNLANGIYLDVKSHDVTVINNTVEEVNGSGIFLNYTNGNIKIQYNTIWKSGESEIYIAGHTVAPHLEIVDNTLVAPDKPQKHYHLISSTYTAKYSLPEIGVIERNKFLNADTALSQINMAFKGSNRSLFKSNEMPGLFKATEDKTNAAHAQNKPVLISNKSNTSRKIALPGGNYTDAENKSFTGEIELAPFQSKVLFKK